MHHGPDCWLGDLAFPGCLRPLLELSGPAACSAELPPALHGLRLPGPKPGFPLASSFGPPPCQGLAWTALRSRGLKTSASLTPRAGPAPHPHGQPQWAGAGGPGCLGSATGQLHTVGPGSHQSWDTGEASYGCPPVTASCPGREEDRVGMGPLPAGQVRARSHSGLHSAQHANPMTLPVTP